MDSQVMLGNQ